MPLERAGRNLAVTLVREHLLRGMPLSAILPPGPAGRDCLLAAVHEFLARGELSPPDLFSSGVRSLQPLPVRSAGSLQLPDSSKIA